MRFSRRSLNIIIFCCLGIISWIHLGKTDIEMEPLEPLNQAPLSPAGWHRWQSHEGIISQWRQISSDHGQVRLVLPQQQVDWTLPAHNWSQELQQHINHTELAPSQLQAKAILIQGPWSEREMQAISAYLIKQLSLRKADTGTQVSFGHCEQVNAAGSLWFRESWSDNKITVSKTVPLRQQWQDFRLQQTQIMRQQWLSNSGQLDIQTDIAYHRPPADYYLTLYRQLGNSQKTAANDYLNCRQALAAQ